MVADEALPTLTVRVANGQSVVERRDVEDALFAAGLSNVPAWTRTARWEWLYSLLRALESLSDQYLVTGARSAFRGWGARMMLTEGVYYAGTSNDPVRAQARLVSVN